DSVLLPARAVPQHCLVDVVIGDDVSSAGGVKRNRLVVLHGDVVFDQTRRGASSDDDAVRLPAGILVRRVVGVRLADHAPIAPSQADVVTVLAWTGGIACSPLAVGFDSLCPRIGHGAEVDGSAR